jgi:hypothetical protein
MMAAAERRRWRPAMAYFFATAVFIGAGVSGVALDDDGHLC